MVLAGKNALIAAETGCGKTLAYLAPVVQQLIRWNQTSLKERPPNSPLAVILCPSRELASQIGVRRFHLANFGLEVKKIELGRFFSHTSKSIFFPAIANVFRFHCKSLE